MEIYAGGQYLKLLHWIKFDRRKVVRLSIFFYISDITAVAPQLKNQVLCRAKARGTVHTPLKHPRDIWAQVVDGPPPSNTAHPTTAPTRPRRQQPRTPAPTPELSATQKWWAALMGDRAFARARAAGKSETEAGHARAKAKAEADIALSPKPSRRM